MESVAANVRSRAAAYLNVKTIIERLERRGHMKMVAETLKEVKKVEDAELKGEVEEEDTFELCEKVFKENLKLILGIVGTPCSILLVDELWADKKERAVRVHLGGREDFEEQADSFGHDEGNEF